MEIFQSLFLAVGIDKPKDQWGMIYLIGFFGVLGLLMLLNIVFRTTGYNEPSIFEQLLRLIAIIAVFAFGCFVIFIIGKAILLIIYTPIPGW